MTKETVEYILLMNHSSVWTQEENNLFVGSRVDLWFAKEFIFLENCSSVKICAPYVIILIIIIIINTTTAIIIVIITSGAHLNSTK